MSLRGNRRCLLARKLPMVTKGVINVDTMPDHSDSSQTDVAEPTNAYVLGIIRFFFFFFWLEEEVVLATLILFPNDQSKN